MKIFVKKNEMPVLGPLIKPVVFAMQRPFAGSVHIKKTDHPPRQLLGHLFQVKLLSGSYRVFHQQRISIKFPKPADRLYDKVIDGYPHRSSPIGVAPKKIRSAVPGIIFDMIIDTTDIDRIGMLFMILGQRSYP